MNNERDWTLGKKMKPIYSQDWLDGTGGWTTEASQAKAPTIPTRINVAHPLAEYAIQFTGNGGWAIAAVDPPATEGTIEIRFQAYVCGSGRNSLSLNVRDKRGGAIYKYSFGEGCAVWANKQPQEIGEDKPARTSLGYRCHRPYELVSRHVIGSGEFTLSLVDLTFGMIDADPAAWKCRSTAAPAMLDFDQEGGSAVAYLGRVGVTLL